MYKHFRTIEGIVYDILSTPVFKHVFTAGVITTWEDNKRYWKNFFVFLKNSYISYENESYTHTYKVEWT